MATLAQAVEPPQRLSQIEKSSREKEATTTLRSYIAVAATSASTP